jgi:exosortase O
METVKRQTSRLAGVGVVGTGSGQAAINLIVLALWLWLYWPVFAYLGILFSREEFRTNQIALAGVLALIALRARSVYKDAGEDAHQGPEANSQGHVPNSWRSALLRQLTLNALGSPPRLSMSALGLALGGSLFFLFSERYLNVNTLSASFFGLASYGLAGMWLAPQRWRSGLPAALLLIGVLPFGEHLETFAGYPLRILTAELVRNGLAAAGVHSIGVDTILVFENGISQVDLPCSGVKSLWTGMLFLVAAGWIERGRIDRRWIPAGLVLVILLFVSNLVRVAVLVAVGQVAGWSLAAEMLHLPLGVLGFSAACAAAALLLRSRQGVETGLQEPAPRPIQAAPRWLGAALASGILGLSLLYSPRPQSEAAQPPVDWHFPPGLITEPMPLTPRESEWLAQVGVESVERRRFSWQGTSGSMILIPSRTWRAHHRPERCFEVYGLTVENWRTYLVGEGFPVRFLSLRYGKGQGSLSAVYWFQTRERATDDYSTRMWADLDPERERWVLVTLLFDQVQDPGSGQVQDLYTALFSAVQANLEGGTP